MTEESDGSVEREALCVMEGTKKDDWVKNEGDTWNGCGYPLFKKINKGVNPDTKQRRGSDEDENTEEEDNEESVE